MGVSKGMDGVVPAVAMQGAGIVFRSREPVFFVQLTVGLLGLLRDVDVLIAIMAIVGVCQTLPVAYPAVILGALVYLIIILLM